MTRLNIEARWRIDLRRDRLAELLGSYEMADGVAFKFWSLAQEYWRERKKVPVVKFESIAFFKEFEQCELAFRENGFIYIKGTKRNHEWLPKRIEAARRGGKRSSKTQAKRKQTYSKTQPSSSISSSSSISKEKIHSVCELYPNKRNKNQGIEKLSKSISCDEDLSLLEIAIKNYAADLALNSWRKPKLLTTFVSDWRYWITHVPADESLKPASTTKLKELTLEEIV